MAHKGTALVTGGARRIGRAIALALAEEGYNIALHCNRSKEEAENTAKEINAKGVQCNIYTCDLGQFLSVETMVSQVFKDFPDCTILVNNAAVFERFSFNDTDEAIFDRHFDVNFKAPFFLTQYFARQCKQGQVVNMLDTYTSKHKSPYFAYLLTKKTLHEFTKMAALALGPHIRVNGVAPGLTELSEDQDPALVRKKEALLPLRQIATLEQIAAAVLQLVNSEYLTGQILRVDGGEHVL